MIVPNFARRSSALLSAALLAGCSSTGGSANVGDVIDLDTNAADVGVDALPDAGRDVQPDAEIPDLPAGNELGEPCESNADCDSQLCIDVIAGEGGSLCTLPCAGAGSCPEDWECVLIRNAGGDAVQVCVPLDLCVDGDGDNYGLGPGCAGPDCDDTNPNISPAATETCNGSDDNCNGIVDTDAPEIGQPCTTSFPGECAAGVNQCEAGSPQCLPLNTPVLIELCDGLDSDCDGRVDEAAACYEDGEPCVEDADCARNRCEDGFCSSGDCDGPCPDRLVPTAGGAEALRSERFLLDFSIGGPFQMQSTSSERFRLQIGPGAFRDPR